MVIRRTLEGLFPDLGRGSKERVTAHLEFARETIETSLVDLNVLSWQTLRLQILELVRVKAIPEPEVIHMEIVYLMRDPEHPDEWGECEESDPWEKVQYRVWAEVEAP